MHLVTYMRISVTDRCNERCAYCMPHDVAIEWLPRGQILTYEEILRVARVATSLGVTKFRITGGEPLVRRNVAEFIGELNKLPGVTDIGLSTNATLLAPLTQQLRDAGVRKFNISLDTLDADLYRELTGNGNLADCLAGIDAAVETGAQVKLNCVLMKGKNDDELLDLIEFAAGKRVPLRFIELMPISTSDVLTDDNFLSVGHARRIIEKKYELVPDDIKLGNGPAVYYRANALPIHLGFIGAMTNLHFCESCNKVRLTADGKLRPCLGAHLEYDLKPVLRAKDSTDAKLREVFVQTIRNKPEEARVPQQLHPRPQNGRDWRMKLTHVDERGKAKMVDVSAKPMQRREAIAIGSIHLQSATMRLIKSNQIAKGDVLNTARLAGIQAAKRTGELIPLCHPLSLTHVDVDLQFERDRIDITATARIAAQTGVEMEALTAVAVAALTIYDMCKAVDKQMVIGRIRLISKTKK